LTVVAITAGRVLQRHGQVGFRAHREQRFSLSRKQLDNALVERCDLAIEDPFARGARQWILEVFQQAISGPHRQHLGDRVVVAEA
jgi:hypothetical protein